MLTIEQVSSLIKAGRPDWIVTAEKESQKYNVHFTGVGVAEYLKTETGYENDSQLKARQEMVTSNRYLFENLTRPIDKVFNATGGNNVYPKKSQKIIDTINNLRHGYSIKGWIKNVQANKYYTDPNGLILFEWDKVTTYPTMKAVSCLFNYQSSGRSVDWVIFNPEKKEDGQFYRVIDESFDYTYRKQNEQLTLVEEKTFKNPFGRCPAIVNSDITHFELDRKDSPFAPVIELADHYLRTGSLCNISERFHGYPIYWAYSLPCKRCHGVGTIEENGEIIECPSCDGTGNTHVKDVTDGIFLKPPTENQQKLSPDLAGYVVPPIESLKGLREIQNDIWQKMHFTVWGTSYQRDQETATASYIDAQPVNERLFAFSESFEDVEQKMTELISLFFYKSANDISINWGKRFMIESPDAIWNKYIAAKEKGANKTTLDYLLSQFYQSEYSNDKESLITSQKRMKLEPFIHLTEKEVKDLGVTGRDWMAKLYFGDWVKSLDEGYIFVTDITKLKTEFEKYIEEKEKLNEPSISDKPQQEIIGEIPPQLNINKKENEA